MTSSEKIATDEIEPVVISLAIPKAILQKFKEANLPTDEPTLRGYVLWKLTK